MLEEVQLNVGREFQEIITLAQARQFLNRKLRGDVSGNGSGESRRYHRRSDLLGIPESVGLIHCAIDFQDFDIKEHFRIEAIVRDDDFLRHLELFRMIANHDRIHLFVGMHAL